MKFAVKPVSALVAGGLVLGAMAVTPAIAGGKACTDPVKRIDAELKRIDKEVTGWFKRDHKR
jgi:hypothetical protein